MGSKRGDGQQESNCEEQEAENDQKIGNRLEDEISSHGNPNRSNLSSRTCDKQQQTDEEVEPGPQNASCEQEEDQEALRIKETEEERKQGTEKETESEVEGGTETDKETGLDKVAVIGKETEFQQETEAKEKSQSEGSEESRDDYADEETEPRHSEDIGEELVEKEIEHFPKIHNDGFESDTGSEISLQVPRVTIAERIRQLSSESQLSLKAWQDADKRKLKGTIIATRSHPKCFSQIHLENVTGSRTVGRYKQGETIPSAGVRTLIFWSNERERSHDITKKENKSQLWASSMSMHSRQGRPIRNLQSVHSCSVRKTDRPQSHEFCSCNRFADHHTAYFHSLQQKARTATFPGFHIFQTELYEDDELCFPRDSFVSPKLEGGFGSKRNNTPVVPLRHHRANLLPNQSYNSFQGYSFGRGSPLTSRSRDSFSLRSSSWETSANSQSHLSARQCRHRPMPGILSLKSRKVSSRPIGKSFNDTIRGTGNFISNGTI